MAPRRKASKAAAKRAPAKAAAKRAPAKRAPARTAAEPVLASVVLRTPQRAFPLGQNDPARANLPRAAMEWTYIVRSRSRWSARQETSDRQAQQAAELLARFGVSDADLAALARAGTVEVDIPWRTEAYGWEARIFPWEYVIGAATRGLRAGAPLTVMRHLQAQPGKAPAGAVKRVLFVASEPGPLRGLYDFDSERELVRRHLGVDAEDDWHALASPSADELHDVVVGWKPDVIHLAGFDTHMAVRELERCDAAAADRFKADLAERFGAQQDIQDGYLLAGPRGRLECADADTLAALLTADSHRPRLVSFNIPSSGARLAPLAVAAGARAAIGFQDVFDDDLAELFYSVLYSTWRRAEWDLGNAFRSAWETVRTQPGQLQGTGIVLWSGTPLFPASDARTAKSAAARRATLTERVAADERRPVQPEDVPAAEVRDWLTLNVKPVDDFNYSLLHNGRALFEHFSLNRGKPGSLRGVHVKVSLSVGSESATFERLLDVDIPTLDLKREIHVPLTSSLTRSVHESVRTSVYVEVAWGAHVLMRNTFKVRLVPVDQWRDTAADRLWLPSFVFPRDAAITRLVSVAQRYVRVLRDDPAAGFDGYQSFDPSDPGTAAEIDLQVRAIWSAIVHELRLGYINPPPGYSRELDSQRLRTPSMVARDQSGTCIDLALFLAACLELVDIYPVIFLLKGHAFPGYWTSSDYHFDFAQARPDAIQDVAPADSKSTAAVGAHREPWMLGASAYREIVQLVNAGKLVPLEAVRLTESCGFAEAMEAGRQNLADPNEFDGMVDIALAREAQVTPLPLWGEQA
jgi:hypothetical protein